jgi:hypothetical protein
MHRSGTSALTRVLNLCGAALPPGRLLPPNDANLDGFWESEPLVHLHDEVLAACGMVWDSTRAFPRDWFASDAAQAFRRRIFDFIQPKLAESRVLVIKDPRLCQLIPLWLGLAAAHGIDLSVVIPLRNPIEVAASLEERDGMPRAHALLLWLRHFVQAEHDTRGVSRCFVTYEALVEDVPGTVRTMAAVLPIEPQDHEQTVAEFVNPERRHHHADAAALGSVEAAAGWIRTAFDWGQRAAHGEDPPLSIMDSIHDALLAAEAIFRPNLDDDTARIEQLTARVAELEQQSASAAAIAIVANEICPERYMA